MVSENIAGISSSSFHNNHFIKPQAINPHGYHIAILSDGLNFEQKAHKSCGHRRPVMIVPNPAYSIFKLGIREDTLVMSGVEDDGFNLLIELRVTLNTDEPPLCVHPLHAAHGCRTQWLNTLRMLVCNVSVHLMDVLHLSVNKSRLELRRPPTRRSTLNSSLPFGVKSTGITAISHPSAFLPTLVPIARAMIWWPKQTPMVRTRPELSAFLVKSTSFSIHGSLSNES
jgi:hypothetical protein